MDLKLGPADQCRKLMNAWALPRDGPAPPDVIRFVDEQVRKWFAQHQASFDEFVIPDLVRELGSALTDTERLLLANLVATSAQRVVNAPPGTNTRLFWRWQLGSKVTGEVFDRFYDKLLLMAKSELPGFSVLQGEISAGEMVSEIFIGLLKYRSKKLWTNEKEFMGLARTILRSKLLDEKKRVTAQKRGGPKRNLPLSQCQLFGLEPNSQVDKFALKEALRALNEESRDHALLLNLLLDHGKTIEEAAQSLGISLSTAKKRKSAAVKFLKRHMYLD